MLKLPAQYLAHHDRNLMGDFLEDDPKPCGSRTSGTCHQAVYVLSLQDYHAIAEHLVIVSDDKKPNS